MNFSLRRGFSLIEVLVVVVVFFIAGSVVLRIFGGGVVSSLFLSEEARFNYKWGVFRSIFVKDVNCSYAVNYVGKTRLVLEVFKGRPELLEKSCAKPCVFKVEYRFKNGKLYRNSKVLLEGVDRVEFKQEKSCVIVRIKFKKGIFLGREEKRRVFQVRELRACSVFLTEEEEKKGVFCSIDKDTSY